MAYFLFHWILIFLHCHFSNESPIIHQWIQESYPVYQHNRLLNKLFITIPTENIEDFFGAIGSQWVFFLENKDGNPKFFIDFLYDFYNILIGYSQEYGDIFMETMGLYLIMASYKVNHWSSDKFNYILKTLMRKNTNSSLEESFFVFFFKGLASGLMRINVYWYGPENHRKKTVLMNIFFNNKNKGLDYYSRWVIVPILLKNNRFFFKELLEKQEFNGQKFPWNILFLLEDPFNDYYFKLYEHFLKSMDLIQNNQSY